jgi:GDPmannose 4,6-dehydratase
MTAIIFGANGQDGHYLGKLLTDKNIAWIGVSRSGDFLRTNIADPGEVMRLVRDRRPNLIFHLAANSTTRHEAWQENHETICTGTLNILEAVRVVDPGIKVFLSGSGLQFLNEGRPIRETDPFEASSPYAVSRIHSVYAARYYRKFGLRIYVGYFFNHDSPLRGERHITKKIAEAAKRIAGGSDEKLSIGDLSVRKEWGFAGDIVRGVWTLVEQEKVFETVIGTGEAYSIREWLETCFSLTGRDWRHFVEEKNDFQAEYKLLVSDPASLLALGWRPDISFHELAKMMLEA